MLNTPDRDLRPQIEAAKAYLREHRFTEVDDPPEIQTQAFERDLHTIRAAFGGRPRLLRLAYGWLQEHAPRDVRSFLDERTVGPMLAADDTQEATISQSGLLNYK